MRALHIVLRFVLILLQVQYCSGQSPSLTRDVYVNENPRWTTYTMPADGVADLTLNVQSRHSPIKSSRVELEDTSDTVSWTCTSRADLLHVYQILSVAKDHEWVRISGTIPELAPSASGGNGCSSVPRDASFRVGAISAQIISLEFTSDHNVLCKTPANNDGWADANPANDKFEKPEYIKEIRSNPITQTKNTLLTAKVKVKVQPEDIWFKLKGASGGLDYLSFSSTSVKSTGQEQEVEVTAKANLPDKICCINSIIGWTITVGSLDLPASNTTGEHVIYVTYGTPAGSVVTEKRINVSVGYAAQSQQTTKDSYAKVISDYLMGFSVSGTDSDGPSPIWLLYSAGHQSQCPGLAQFINAHFMILGLGSGETRYCYAIPDGGVTYSTNRGSGWTRLCTPGKNGHSDDTGHDTVVQDEYLGFMSGNAFNYYEAACYFNGRYYAVGVGQYTTPAEVLFNAAGGADNIGWFYESEEGMNPCDLQPWAPANAPLRSKVKVGQ